MFQFLEKIKGGKDLALWIPSSVSLNKALALVAMFWGIIALGDQIKGEIISGHREEAGKPCCVTLTFRLYPELVFMTLPGALSGTRGSDTDCIRNMGCLAKTGNKG